MSEENTTPTPNSDSIMELICWSKSDDHAVSFKLMSRIAESICYTWSLKPSETSRFRVGRIYQVKGTHDANGLTCAIGAAKHLCIHDDKDLVAKLESIEEIRLAELERKKLALRDRDYGELERRLLPIRKLYANTIPSSKRRAIELLVLDALHSRPTDKEMREFRP